MLRFKTRTPTPTPTHSTAEEKSKTKRGKISARERADMANIRKIQKCREWNEKKIREFQVNNKVSFLGSSSLLIDIGRNRTAMIYKQM